MADNLSFIKLDINIMNDTKIKIICKMPAGSDMLKMWLGVLCLGMKSGTPGVLEIGDGIPFEAETLSNELDIPLQTVKLGLKTFEKLKMIEYAENGTIFISNFEKHQELDKIRLGKEKTRLRVQQHRDKVKQIACNGYSGVTVTECNDTEEEIDLEEDKEEDKEETKNKKPIKHKHGANNNVLLTQTEYDTIITEYTDYQHKIDNLSYYLASTGKTYKSHYMTIKNWARNDKKPKPKEEFSKFHEICGDNK